MNQDNQVGWNEKEFDELLALNGWFGKEAADAVSPVLKDFISRVAQDSYDTGYNDGESSKQADFQALLDEFPEEFKKLYGERFIEQIKKDSYAEGIGRARGSERPFIGYALGNIEDGATCAIEINQDTGMMLVRTATAEDVPFAHQLEEEVKK